MFDFGTNEEWSYHSNTECVVFTVINNEEKINCRISMEAIVDHYGDCEEDEILDKAKEHFDEITDIVGHKITANKYEKDGSILIRTNDF